MGWESTLTQLNSLHLLSSCLQVMVTGDLQYFLLLPETESPNVERRKVPEHLIIKRIMIWSFHLNRKYAVVSGLFIYSRKNTFPSILPSLLDSQSFLCTGQGKVLSLSRPSQCLQFLDVTAVSAHQVPVSDMSILFQTKVMYLDFAEIFIILRVGLLCFYG